MDVKRAGASVDLIWSLQEDGNEVIGKEYTANKTQKELEVEIDQKYNGKKYTFTAYAPSGWEVDGSYSENGYENGYKNAGGTDAGEYRTTVRLIDGKGGVDEYTIVWSIDKAKFDLSEVKWEDNGKVEYRDGIIEIKIEGAPEKL